MLIIRWQASFRIIIQTILFSSMICFANLYPARSSLAEDCKPLQISLWPPVQLTSSENSICGVRLNFLRGDNISVTGIDVGMGNVAESLKGIELGGINSLSGPDGKESWGIQIAGINYLGNASFRGGQIGVVNGGSSEASMIGLQVAVINFYNGKMNGIQLGLGNGSDPDISGIQLSLFQQAKNVMGLQIGLENAVSRDVHGVQIGIGNSARDLHGVQVGVLNICESLSGLQIGILNIVTSRFPDKGLFVSPLINFGF